MTLKNAKLHKTYKVLRVNGKGSFRRRIMEMGITKDTLVTVKLCAPFGDPLLIGLRGFELALRKADADGVEVIEWHLK